MVLSLMDFNGMSTHLRLFYAKTFLVNSERYITIVENRIAGVTALYGIDQLDVYILFYFSQKR